MRLQFQNDEKPFSLMPGFELQSSRMNSQCAPNELFYPHIQLNFSFFVFQVPLTKLWMFGPCLEPGQPCPATSSPPFPTNSSSLSFGIAGHKESRFLRKFIKTFLMLSSIGAFIVSKERNIQFIYIEGSRAVVVWILAKVLN